MHKSAQYHLCRRIYSSYAEVVLSLWVWLRGGECRKFVNQAHYNVWLSQERYVGRDRRPEPP